MRITGNEPATPLVYASKNDLRSGAILEQKIHPGLTIRQQFAAMAMQGMLAKEAWTDRIANEHDQFLSKEFAKASVNIADALIAELNKPIINETDPITQSNIERDYSNSSKS